ncbi:hypothetical protein Hbl1158_00070 [Halobaculum sp. CBA1158]|uniref:DUF7553 family protein n=1 Tax=Halobaculum sp. CBA1158 TaxID=2904243 RepID=UPI001F2BD86F|nr:hypothetical protein [Halobaculum sp. CBA1158]UIO99811.1 hypothetical protein Hbl1158_00070 [Halobaculum sp. CBA1158]
MRPELLTEASEHAQRAAESADGEPAERLENAADALASAVDRERGPDHGWLAKQTHVLREAAGNAGGDAEEHVADAVECINEYREDLPGV